jgi:hypothetical protein
MKQLEKIKIPHLKNLFDQCFYQKCKISFSYQQSEKNNTAAIKREHKLSVGCGNKNTIKKCILRKKY